MVDQQLAHDAEWAKFARILKGGKTEEAVRMFPNLPRGQGCINKVYCINENKHTFLGFVVSFGTYHNFEIIQLLLSDPEIDVNKNSLDNSPLEWAIKSGCDYAVEMILAHKNVKLHRFSYATRSAFGLAANLGRYKICKLLLKHEKVDPVIRDFRTISSPIINIVGFNDVEMMEKVLCYYAAYVSQDQSAKKRRARVVPLPASEIPKHLKQIFVRFNLQEYIMEPGRGAIFDYLWKIGKHAFDPSQGLQYACDKGNVSMVDAFLEFPDINILSKPGYLPKEYMSRHPLFRLLSHSRPGDHYLVRKIIYHKSFNPKILDIERLNHGSHAAFAADENPKVIREILAAPGLDLMLYNSHGGIIHNRVSTALCEINYWCEWIIPYIFVHPSMDALAPAQAIGFAVGKPFPLLEEFMKDKEGTRRRLREELGINELRHIDAAQFFVLAVECHKGEKSRYDISKLPKKDGHYVRFINTLAHLPMELQMRVCNLAAGVDRDSIRSQLVNEACEEYEIK